MADKGLQLNMMQISVLHFLFFSTLAEKLYILLEKPANKISMTAPLDSLAWNALFYDCKVFIQFIDWSRLEMIV